jgi:hypothetical protein
MSDSEEAPVFKTWRTIAPVRGWPRRPAVVKVKKEPRAKKQAKAPATPDAYGYKPGTAGARINAVLAAEPCPSRRSSRRQACPRPGSPPICGR